MSTQKTYKAHFIAVLTLGLPLIGGHLAQLAIGLTDTIMMGWYGVPELAALTIAGSFFFVLFLFGSGFAWAIMPMIASFAVQGDDIQIRRATRMAAWLSGIYFALVAPLLWFSGPLLLAMGQTTEVADLAQQYLRVAGFGMAPALGVMVLKNYLAGQDRTAMVLFITVAAALLNVVFNYVLVFGNWGAPELGITGAAIASVAVQILSLGLVWAYARWEFPDHALLQRFWKPDWDMLQQVMRMGLPIGLTTLAEVALFAGASVLMGWLGTIPLAAHGIALQIASATFLVQMGLSNAATVRAGNALGRGDVDHMIRGAHVVMILGAIGVALSIALFVLIPETLIGLFLDPDDPDRAQIVSYGAALMVMAALFQLFDAAQVLHMGVLRGLQDTRVPMLMATFAYWGVGMPAAYGIGFGLGWGGQGVWLGLVLGLAVASALLMHRFWTRGRAMMVSNRA